MLISLKITISDNLLDVLLYLFSHDGELNLLLVRCNVQWFT